MTDMPSREEVQEALAYYKGLAEESIQFARSPYGKVLMEAARLWLEQTCPNCNGTGIRGHYEHTDEETGEHLGNQDIPCSVCSGAAMTDPPMKKKVCYP